jgi:hypothetical protein
MLMIIVYILWFAAGIPVLASIAPFSKDIAAWKKMVIGIVIILGAPCMLLTQAIEAILDSFLEEGWNNDDENKFG